MMPPYHTLPRRDRPTRDTPAQGLGAPAPRRGAHPAFPRARHAPALARLARHYEAQPEARRDLEQDILISLWRAQHAFRGDCSERTWVYRVAHNTAASHVARRIRDRRDDGSAPRAPEPPRAPDEVTAERAAIRRLDERVRALDLASRQLVLLALEGCTTAEIAEVTGC